MTLYERIKQVDLEEFQKLGVLKRSVPYHIKVYECFLKYRNKGIGKMQSYAFASEECFTCEDNVREIVRNLEQEI